MTTSGRRAFAWHGERQVLFWKTYHQAIREYIQKNILD